MPIEQNISTPPTTQSSAVENYPPHKESGHKKKRLGSGGIAFMVGGGTLVATCAALAIAISINRSRAQKHKMLEDSNRSLCSLPVSTTARGTLIKCITDFYNLTRGSYIYDSNIRLMFA